MYISLYVNHLISSAPMPPKAENPLGILGIRILEFLPTNYQIVPIMTQKSKMSSAPKGTQTPNGEADSIFMKSTSLATDTRECKIVFVAPTSDSNRLRLIVTRDGGKTRDVVYVFREVIELSGAKPGNKVSMFVEKRHSDSKNQDFWNCTALAVME